jgi:hypothetical protein
LVRHLNHPGIAHYIIHSVDYPSLAELGLKAARAYATIGPDSAHALHMPSHIFTTRALPRTESVPKKMVAPKIRSNAATRRRYSFPPFAIPNVSSIWAADLKRIVWLC